MKKSLLICLLAVVLCVSMLFAACAPSLEADVLNSMKEIIYNMYKDGNPTNTYKVTGMVASSGERAYVQWTVDVTAGDKNAVKVGAFDEASKQVTIELDPKPRENVAYTLTATLTNEKGKAYEIDGEPVSISFNRSLEAFVVNTYAEYLAACQANNGAGSGESVRIQAYVIGVVCMSSSSKGSLYLQDADGHGYYAYAPVDATEGCTTDAELRAKWPIGTEVYVSGTVTTYNGQYEFNKGCEVVKTGNTATAEQLPYVDATAAFAAAETNEDTALAAYQNRRVTLKDATITSVDIQLNADGSYNKVYYYFTLPGSDVEFNVYYTIYFIDEATMLELHEKLEVGTMVDLTGVVSVYSKAFQIYPDSANSVSNIREITYTDAEKVAMAKDNLVIVDSAKEGDELALPAEGALDTTITWALAEGQTYDFATLADGKLTITATPSSTTKIQLVATITSGSESATKAFQVTVEGTKIDWLVTADALEICDALENGATTPDYYYFYGTVGEIYNTGYCNFYLLDKDGNSIVVYGLYAPNGTDRYGSNREIAEIPFQEGDLICLRAKVQKYVKNESVTPELVNAVLVETPAKGTEFFVGYSATEALEICDALENGATTPDYAYFMGVVGEIYNTQYCNFYLTDANGGSIVVYGLYAPNGTDRYGSNREIAEIPFKEGDIIYLRAKVQKYVKNESVTPELVNAVLVSFSAPSVPVHTCESKCVVCGGCENATCTEEACTTKCSCVATEAPVAGTYNLKLVHTNPSVNKVLYFTGAMDGHYFATSENEADAVVITLVKLENGKYTMQLANGKYLAIVPSGTYINVVMQDTAAEWTWNAKLGNFTIDVNGTAYFYGTSSTGTYTTISQRKLSDASTTCQANLVALSGGDAPAHTCESVCPTCNKCLDKDCTDAACADKCEGHVPPHACTSVCPTCNKCKNEDCAESVCAEKCEGHEPVVEDVTYVLDIAAIGGTKLTANLLVNDIFTATIGVKNESIKLSGASYEADGLTFSGKQLSLTSGKAGLKNDAMNNSILFTVEAGKTAHVVVYAASNVYNDGREIKLTVLDAEGNTVTVTGIKKDGVAVDEFAILSTTTVEKYEFDLPAGTYNFGGTAGGAWIYKLSVTLSAAPAHECEDVCEECGKCTSECADAVCADKCAGHTAIVVIDGKEYYSEAKAEAALRALAGGEKVAILTNATIAEAHTFVAADYTLGEGATLTIQANVVVPAGTKLTASANATIVVEAGAHIDLSALTRDEFATSTSARLEIAEGAKVTMPAFTEALWNDAYLKVIIEAMIADSDNGAQLVLGETTLTKEADGWKVPVAAPSVAAYNFATTSTKKGTKLDNASALTLFQKSSTSTDLVSVAVTNIYDGNGDGGAYPQQGGFIKTGKSKTAGQLVLTFAEGKKVAKVEIKCHDWNTKSDSYPTNSNKVAVNGGTAVLAPYNTTGAPEVMTFELDGSSNVVTIDTKDRVFIFEIIVTFAD